MSDKASKILVMGGAVFLILLGICLYKLFEYQGYKETKERNAYVSYEVNDYVTVSTVDYYNLDDVYNNIEVNRVTFKNIDENLTKEFLDEEEELINYVKRYYNEIKKEEHTNLNTVNSKIKTIVNDTVLSVYYEIEFVFDENIYNDNIRNYILTFNVDLKTMKVLNDDDLLNKFNYTKEYISEKIFNDDILINDNEIVIDKNTNISFTKKDIERRKEEYINRIVADFNNIIKMYIERGSLVLVYDSKEVKTIFFDGNFDTDIKIRYLK